MTAPGIVPHKYDIVPVDAVKPHPANPNKGDVDAIGESIDANGFYGAILVHAPTGHILAGEHRWRAARERGLAELPALLLDCDEATARRILAGDNAYARMAEWDEDALAALLGEMRAAPGGLTGSGFTEADLARLVATGDAGEAGPRPSLADRFLAPPFDVLDGRAGWWRERKARWLSLGIQSEIGRLDEHGGKAAAMRGGTSGWLRADPQFYAKKEAAEQAVGRSLTTHEFTSGFYDQPKAGMATGKSIFDPVLCELAYRWFCPPGGTIIDPFAGGSVRGLLAAMLGHPYRGCDLSPAQVAANEEQAAEFQARRLLGDEARPEWETADAQSWVTRLPPESADMLLTCPPYYDLERYSDEPLDLSTMDPVAFDANLAGVMHGAAAALRWDRWAVVVTGDPRDTRGELRDLRAATIGAARHAGLRYCSGAVLLTPIGSLPFAATRVFGGTRGLLRAHQDVLVFCKGSRAAAARACGPVEVAMPEGIE